MSDPALLSQALLAAVPAAGSIGNQSLLERLRSQFPQLSEDQFWTARDALIAPYVRGERDPRLLAALGFVFG